MGTGSGDPEDVNVFLIQPATSENGSGVKKLGALVDYNDSDSDEGKLSFISVKQLQYSKTLIQPVIV